MNYDILKKSAVIFLLFISYYAFGDYNSTIAEDYPVAWWNFSDENYNDGQISADVIGNIADSTFSGDVSIINGGIGGQAAWFNGNVAGVDLGNSLGAILSGSSAITCEMWLKCDYVETGTIQRLFATRINENTAGIDIGLGRYLTGQYYLRAGLRSSIVDSYLQVNATFSEIGQWAHIACVVDYAADNVKIYINGSEITNQTVNFVSSVYSYENNPTQTDQIGRAPDYSNCYRGWLDEVAIYTRSLSEIEIGNHYNSEVPQEPEALWDSVVADEGTAVGPFLGSPSICRMSNSALIASYDYWGDNNPRPSTNILKISYDDGLTWQARSEVPGSCFATLFEDRGVLYLFGISGNNCNIVISRSFDYGLSWKTSTLYQGDEPFVIGYATGPVPVVVANGRIYRVFEKNVADVLWPQGYAVLLVSADATSDLLDPSSWTMTNQVGLDSDWVSSWNCTSPGWLEGNVVEDPDRQIKVVMRVHSNPVVDKAAILALSSDNTTLNFDSSADFIDMPGGMHKFTIRKDPVTGFYLAFVNNNTDPSRPQQRNTLSLIKSLDLVNWEHVKTIIQDDSAMSWTDSLSHTGFQYVDWQFDGDDIVFLSRTSYDGAANYHDSNKITFHRLVDYFDVISLCGDWGYSEMDFNYDCVVNFLDVAFFLEEWLVCTNPADSDCVMR